ncbi:hypothetical protein [Paludifilum halophilum]|uniref:Uncharacterized protein n=1 Tax=Paludifilum halophilum TaxID=1642702 RepID=A0A235B4Q6_9BACL|nr:hypothetical protein [Paludifilum halophilum]OYD07263.1 hypothetical protein CHM34_12845 [Paludifilum halophilum]
MSQPPILQMSLFSFYQLDYWKFHTFVNRGRVQRSSGCLTTIGNTYTDENVPKSEVYKYTVIGHKKLPDKKVKENKTLLKEEGIKVTASNQKDLLYEKKELGMIIRKSEVEYSKETIDRSDFSYPNG